METVSTFWADNDLTLQILASRNGPYETATSYKDTLDLCEPLFENLVGEMLEDFGNYDRVEEVRWEWNGLNLSHLRLCPYFETGPEGFNRAWTRVERVDVQSFVASDLLENPRAHADIKHFPARAYHARYPAREVREPRAAPLKALGHLILVIIPDAILIHDWALITKPCPVGRLTTFSGRFLKNSSIARLAPDMT